MTRLEALQLLDSKTLHDRLRAARYLAVHAHADDEQRIRQQLAKEEVSWVRGALRTALERLSSSVAPREKDRSVRDLSDEQRAGDVYAQAIEETTAMLVHELEPILGLLRLYAQTEIGEYAASQTKRQLDRLESVLTAVDTLSRAAAVPRISELHLAYIIRRVVATELKETVDIELAGPDPVTAWGDVSLVELAVANGVRNAVEASENGGKTENKARVVVNWGETDKDYWIVVLDRGVDSFLARRECSSPARQRREAI